MISHYDLFGVRPDADSKTITKAYRRLMKKAHPDMGGDPDFVKRVLKAYEILNSPHKRAAYDSFLRANDRSTAKRASSANGQRAKPKPRPQPNFRTEAKPTPKPNKQETSKLPEWCIQIINVAASISGIAFAVSFLSLIVSACAWIILGVLGIKLAILKDIIDLALVGYFISMPLVILIMSLLEKTWSKPMR